MKKNTHPEYREVLFVDSSTGHRWICRSALQTNEVGTFEDKEYPLYRLAISSSSHPFFTGKTGIIDVEGRVDKFNKRYPKATANS